MPLPFRQEKPDLPNNKATALVRLGHLRRCFKKDPIYFSDYKAFMLDIIENGEAERVSEGHHQSQGPVWYIPHHGVYHPKKPGKIRVVFDCAAKFKGTCLNDHLLQGPDQMNTLVGVLCRFRMESIALMCDIERMFHRFLVHKEDRDYLRFLWWSDGNIEEEPVEYRMKVHLFGAASSPGCAIYGLRYVANKYKDLSPDAASFILGGFYMDDGLISEESAEKSCSLIKGSTEICRKGNIRVHKFASNSREVLESVLASERAKDIMNLNLALDDLPIERALGIEWCVESDEFCFRVILKEQPLTRRGILSMISSVFDPLGFLAPFILKGKQILQELCTNGADWDQPLPEELHPKWESWRRNLHDLAKIKIPRCYKPENFGTAVQAELHHFSDASLSGYGQCS
ncbi:uncharacterized protein LOC135500152 [Lineus longissimus]|uniref:uncharacterized protein LOC135500152 n=1 Tax=Lineus longissimus TaxID=88925 RepID=UPI00315CD1F1